MKAVVVMAALLLAGSARADPAAPPTPARQHELVRIVRQDCGSCHGMRLTGGMGPALTREALAGRSVAELQGVIAHGRPGTPMPGWQSMLDARDVRWIAVQLKTGFPKE